MKRFLSVFLSVLLALACVSSAFADPGDPIILPTIPIGQGGSGTQGNTGEIILPDVDFDPSYIEVTTAPTKTSYLEGKDALDLTGGVITVHEESGSATVNMTETGVTVTGFDNTVVGEQTLTVSYLGKTATFKVTVVAKSETGVVVKTGPSKSQYKVGEQLNLAGATYAVTYNNGTESEPAAMTADMVSGFSTATLGTNTLTLTYKTFTATFGVTIVDRTATGITVSTAPAKTAYVEGQALDRTGGIVTVTYDAGADTTVALTDTAVTVTGFDSTKVGEQTLTVKYNNLTTTFKVTVAAKVVTGITVTAPAKTSYLEGKDAFDPAGGKVTVTYDNGTTEEIPMTAAMVSGFDNTKVGEQTLTVTCEGKTATFKVTITAKAVTSTELSAVPEKTEYAKGEALDLTGAKIKLTYDNGTSEEIPVAADSVTGYDPNAVGEQTVTVTFGGQSFTFKVQVVQAGGYDAVKDIQKDDTTNYGADKFVVRSAGDLRFDTALKTAEDLKIALAADKFDSIIVAASHNFPDALGGSYLAARKSAPILIVRTGDKTQGVDKAVDFIKKNLADNGTVYILGGESAVSAAAEGEIKGSGIAGIKVRRLAGTDRYGTNLEILKEAGVDAGADLLVADARNFADALSASALGRPILLINNKKTELTADQKAYLTGKSFGKIYVLGGVAAVPEAIVSSIKASLPGTESKRLAGDGRYETSIAIAEEFFPNPEVITLATGTGFPDGLTGGSLAFGLNAPLILTREKNMNLAAQYAQTAGVRKFVVFGGESAMPGKVVSTIVGGQAAPSRAVQ